MTRTNHFSWITGRMAISAWAMFVCLGMIALVRYQMTPASQAKAAPIDWPRASTMTAASAKFTLIMAVHPKCPCSAASMSELAQLVAHAGSALTVHVLFVDPAGAPGDWLHTDLWRQAAAIPGVLVLVDADGHEAAAFDATTSGQVALYDPRGKLVFNGGITDGRGHEGDNPGLDAILAILHDRPPLTRRTPVYGCSLTGCTIAPASPREH